MKNRILVVAGLMLSGAALAGGAVAPGPGAAITGGIVLPPTVAQAIAATEQPNPTTGARVAVVTVQPAAITTLQNLKNSLPASQVTTNGSVVTLLGVTLSMNGEPVLVDISYNTVSGAVEITRRAGS